MSYIILIFCFLLSDVSALEIFADHAKYSTFHREVEFLDNVNVIFDDAVMTTNRVIATIEDDNFEVKSAVADGGVFIKTSQETATSNRAIYNAKEHLLTLLDDVQINRQGIKITSSTYTIDTETHNSKLGNSVDQRVKIKIE